MNTPTTPVMAPRDPQAPAIPSTISEPDETMGGVDMATQQVLEDLAQAGDVPQASSSRVDPHIARAQASISGLATPARFHNVEITSVPYRGILPGSERPAPAGQRREPEGSKPPPKTTAAKT